ncbi:AbiU2 domain-containing protein [Sneathiella aquimaris]|uniref:AbiU2 domain-containing protein n=1 Tax=Sneathiella aquimaris TaxID=2599305 RepID=UPI00146EF7F3|nr:hypothetical protein [Sneathiella aquimaris]
MTKNKKMKWPENLSDEERIQKAKELTDILVDHARALLPVQANAQHIVYSSSLANQIPMSYAANAFITLQYSVHFFLLVRLCAIWDSGAIDRESILTVHALINTPQIKKKIVEDICQWHLDDRQFHPNSADDTEIFRAELSLDQKNAQQPSETIEGKTTQWLEDVTTRIEKANTRYVDKKLKANRDMFIAHNLALAVGHKQFPEKIKYGDEKPLLAETIKIITLLHRVLNNADFDWDKAKKQTDRNAEQLWSNCTFSIQNKH